MESANSSTSSLIGLLNPSGNWDVEQQTEYTPFIPKINESGRYTPNRHQPTMGYSRAASTYCFNTADALHSCFKAVVLFFYNTLKKLLKIHTRLINTPFVMFLWVSSWQTYNMINKYWHDNEKEKPLKPFSNELLTVSIFLIVRLFISTFIDFMSANPADTKFSSKLAQGANPILIGLFHIVRFIFFITAAAYALSYVTGMVLIFPESTLPLLIMLTILYEFPGIAYYYLFNNIDIEEHVFGLAYLPKEIWRCVWDPQHLARALLYFESSIAIIFYRMVVAGNDFLMFNITISYMANINHNTIKNSYLTILGATLISTMFSRIKCNYRIMCPTPLSLDEKNEKKKLSYVSYKDISTLIKGVTLSAAIGYLIWKSCHNLTTSIVGAVAYFLFHAIVNIDVNRTHRAIALSTQKNEMDRMQSDSAREDNNECEFDQAIKKLQSSSTVLIFISVLFALIGRSTRIDPLPAFIYNNDQALDHFNITSLKFDTDTRLASAVYIGLLTVAGDVFLYSAKIAKSLLSYFLRYNIFSQEETNTKFPVIRACYKTIFDETPKETFSTESIRQAAPLPQYQMI